VGAVSTGRASGARAVVDEKVVDNETTERTQARVSLLKAQVENVRFVLSHSTGKPSQSVMPRPATREKPYYNVYMGMQKMKTAALAHYLSVEMTESQVSALSDYLADSGLLGAMDASRQGFFKQGYAFSVTAGGTTYRLHLGWDKETYRQIEAMRDVLKAQDDNEVVDAFNTVLERLADMKEKAPSGSPKGMLAPG
jgi:hypothetical protein